MSDGWILRHLKKVHAVAESSLVAKIFMMMLTVVDYLMSNKSELLT